MKVYLGSDHGGFHLKDAIKADLLSRKIDVEDCGALFLDPVDDYPAFIAQAARKVAAEKDVLGIVFGKSGAGEAIVANKIPGIRCVQGFTPENVRLSREHNNANMLSLGEAFIPFELAKELVSVFLDTKFSDEERHIRRIEQIKKIEEQELC